MDKQQLIKKYWKLNTILQDGMFEVDPGVIEDEMIEISGVLDDEYNYQII